MAVKRYKQCPNFINASVSDSVNLIIYSLRTTCLSLSQLGNVRQNVIIQNLLIHDIVQSTLQNKTKEKRCLPRL